jgi:hypothetical protein
MSTVQDLMGLGMPAALANRLGNSVTALTTTGTTAGTAAKITTHVTVLTTAGSQTGAILPDSSLGQPYYVVNSTSTGGVVYPSTGTTFITSASTSYSMAQYNGAIFIRVTSTTWAVITGA